MKKRKTMVLAGGGSGGHITPLVAVATRLKDRDKEVSLHYIGSRNDAIARQLLVDSGLVDRYSQIFSGKLRRFSGFKGFNRLRLWRNFFYNLRDIFGLIAGTFQSLGILIIHRPQLIFSKGGYPSLPVCLVARFLHIPVVNHDSDAISGLTHQVIASKAKVRLFGVMPQTLRSNWRYVGVPVDASFFKPLDASAKDSIRKTYGISAQQLILITGGGLGSRNLNQAAVSLARKLQEDQQILVVTGTKFYQYTLDLASQLTNKERQKLIIVEFTKDMSDLMRLSEIVIVRAGATTLAEVSASGKPTIIVPNPLLPGAHQLHNSKVFEKRNAAIVVADYGRHLDQDQLNQAVEELLSDPAKKKELSENISALAVKDSLDMVIDSLQEYL